MNKFMHRQYRRWMGQAELAGFKIDCSVYTPVHLDGGTTVKKFEEFVSGVGVGELEWMGFEDMETAWKFHCNRGKCGKK